MKNRATRRQVLKGAAASCAVLLVPAGRREVPAGFRAAGRDVEILVLPVSEHTLRLTIRPADLPEGGRPMAGFDDGSLLDAAWDAPVAKFGVPSSPPSVRAGNFSVSASTDPLTLAIRSSRGQLLQQLKVDRDSGVLSFSTGSSPLLGLGEGGPQFDRRGSTDAMRSGQGGYKLETHGGRVPIPWLVGTSGWAMYFHQPYGTFDFTGTEGRFLPGSPEAALPLDLLFVASNDPGIIMAEYARITGHPEMPPLWSFGYQQSHRTLASREEVVAEARTFREKKLPCDALIYLGTGFCPSGWNTANGSFEWNARVFPDPRQVLDELHQQHFRVVLHSVIETERLRGTAKDKCEAPGDSMEEASCLWKAHRKDFALGVDGWWPDEGDPLDAKSRLVRNRMYWEGAQLDRPNERPYALHRNGYAGMQRYGSFLWSGDVYSKWETLKVHIPIAINTALTGIPLWGTDIGGFVPTREFTAELFLRWFQFGAFCPLFRSHGRTWKLRLPWGWNTGDPGPVEIKNYDGASVPGPDQLHNPQVETICRKYLNLRYQLLPYLYSVMHECAKTGMPILRALWLHYSDDPKAVATGDQYMWGPALLVAPVVEEGARSRLVYLPRGEWHDFWTGERLHGGVEIRRPVDLETMPLYVRAGALLPLGPVKQYAEEPTKEPLSVVLYPGADGSFLFYEDDGRSFDYRKGQWTGIQMDWQDGKRRLKLSLAPGSRMLVPGGKRIEVKLGKVVRQVLFDGHSREVSFG